MKLGFISFLLVMFATACLQAEEVFFYRIVLGQFNSRPTALSEAKRAAIRLKLPLVRETLETPSPPYRYQGRNVAVYPEQGKYVVTGFLASVDWQAMAEAALTEIRPFYPNATLEKLSRNDIVFNDAYFATSIHRLLILGSSKNYDEAVKRAKMISKKLGIAYATRGLVYDPKLGLVWPATDEDDVAYYMSRRYDDECGDENLKECISVERSDAYEGLTKGLFVILGGIDKGAEKRLKRAKQIVPDAYIKRGAIDLGCRS